MVAAAETISNRGASTGGVLFWARTPALLLAAEFGLIGLFYAFVSPPGMLPWLGVLFLAEAAAFPFLTWYSSVTSVEVSSDHILVHTHGRSKALAMQNIATIEAHRHWQSPWAKGRPPPFYLDLRMAKGLTRRLQYLHPEAGDRLLYALYRLQKPILVYNWQ